MDKQARDTVFSSASVEMYTPPWLLGLVREVLGEIALDPASSAVANETVRAARYFDLAQDGLAQSWRAPSLFLNPPYGRPMRAFMHKLDDAYRAGQIGQAVALVPVRTGTRWWRSVADYPVCFLHGRLRFLGQANGAPFDSALIYLGQDLARFVAVFASHGRCYQPVVTAAGHGAGAGV